MISLGIPKMHTVKKNPNPQIGLISYFAITE